jgi:hypothetical protein
MSHSNVNEKGLTELLEKITHSSSKIKPLIKNATLSGQILVDTQNNLKQCFELISKVESSLSEEVKENAYQVNLEYI